MQWKASCNQTVRTLPVTSDWKPGVNEAPALSNSPGICGACNGKPVAAIVYEEPGPEGWTSSYAVSTSAADRHGGDKYTVCLCTMDAPEAPTNVLLTLTGPSLGRVFTRTLGDNACSLEVAGQGCYFRPAT